MRSALIGTQNSLNLSNKDVEKQYVFSTSLRTCMFLDCMNGTD